MSIAELPFPTLTTPATDKLADVPVAVIGAGPVGLAAAAELLERGIETIVFERGNRAGAAVEQWGHTRLFSPWEYVVSPAAARLLEGTGWEAPAAASLPYGTELVHDYLLPLAATDELAPRIRYRSTVAAISRQGMDRTRSAGRAETPFLLRVTNANRTEDVLARAVIDASGTYFNPNSIGSSGLDPVGFDDVANHVSHALPDVLGRERARFAGKHTLVVGTGHSAANTLIALATLADEVPGTSVTWAIRNETPARVYGAATDELTARASIGARVHDFVRNGAIALIDRFEIDSTEAAENGRVRAMGRRNGETTTIEADTIVGATGFRPDLDMLREIRLSLDEIVEAPRALAPLIDPNLHSCGTVPPHGVVELTHPEPNFYVVGMKSYGRAPTFLLLTGYEQVRSIADELAGDKQAARRVQLVLPETGVCSSSGPTDSGHGSNASVGSCCS
ncbi:NAD(P)-binding domain-containing protein [Microbacterium sp. STN6]|uniref:NAD(P)-binding domain-containing protein n=1 Tax=Microbacterium sp. STN6 TaxID=2995588 RepID=UPI002260C338|nr:NAD(P)-binding domain-containing protein [Microbacterium sp. STN6]MCX7521971.1 NAD(P)-binding domain-containing protein [Microbacterium sp. STN6]